MKVFLVLLLVGAAVGCAVVASGKPFQVLRDQAFVTRGDQSLTGDLYLPDSPGLRPAMVVVHGGGWTNRSGDMTAICRRLVNAGFVVFNVTYRLAPAHRYPAPLDDVNAALEWIYANAERYRIDPDQIGGWGYSAGAHLILLAGLARQQPPFLSSIVAGGTPAKLTAWPKSPLVTELIGKPMAEAEATWQEASPVNHVEEDSPPVLLYHGQWDALVQPEQMEFMRQALVAKGVPVETYTVHLLGHIGTYLLGDGAERRGVEFALTSARDTIPRGSD